MALKDKITGCPDPETCIRRGFCVGGGVEFATNGKKLFCLEGMGSQEILVDADAEEVDRKDPNSQKRLLHQ